MALKKAEIEEFRQRLHEMRAKLTNQLVANNENVKQTEEGRGYSQHQADEGTDDFDRTISLELSNSEYRTLKMIDRALEKIDEDTYGICDVTNKPIPKARLEAIPYANMTVQAQEAVERGEIS